MEGQTLTIDCQDTNIVAKPEDYRHSSYRSYLSTSNEDLVSRELILEMVSANRRNAPKHYQDFVENARTHQLDNPLTKVYAGAVLGGLSSAAVAKTSQRFSKKITKERSIRKRVEAIGAQLSRVKG